MKKVILAALAVLTMASSVFAATGTVNGKVSIVSPPITVQKDGDMSALIFKEAGIDNYTDVSPGWQTSLATPAKFMATGETGAAFQLTYPANVVATNGADTATVSYDCRVLDTGYPVNKTDGTACSTSATSHASTGKLYQAFFATGVDFSAGAATGLFGTTLTNSVNH